MHSGLSAFRKEAATVYLLEILSKMKSAAVTASNHDPAVCETEPRLHQTTIGASQELSQHAGVPRPHRQRAENKVLLVHAKQRNFPSSTSRSTTF